MKLNPVNSPIPSSLAAARSASAPKAENSATPQSGDSVSLSGPAETTQPQVSSLPDGAAPEYVEGEVLVKLKGNIFQSETTQRDFLNSYGASLLETFDFPKDIFQSFDGDLVRLKLAPGQSAEEAVAQMSKDGRVEYAVTNDIYTLDDLTTQEIPDDLDSRLWGLHNTGQAGGKEDADIDAPEAWSMTTGKRLADGGPLIAVIDTGIDYNHPDLVNNVWTNPGEIAGDGIDNDGNGVIDDVHGYNAFADNGDPMDGHSHGTHCAGTIGAEGNNGQGVVGVNQQATIMGVKIFSDEGSTTTDAIIRGILYATKMGARVTSNSWGGGRANEAIKDAFKNSPAMHIMAAGNNRSDNDKRPHFPSNYDLPNLIAVAATDSNDRLASFSNYGEQSVDIAAPGNRIFSTVPGGNYAYKSGTSMATPHVSGVAGLVLSQYPELSNEELKDRILKGANKVDALDGKVATGARLNAANALDIDRLAPATPNDFAVTESHTNRVVLGFTATGDDGWCGKANAYELRMSNTPITDADSFAQARLMPSPQPGEPDNPERISVLLAPSAEERQLYFGLKVYDNVGNASELVTASGTVPAADLAYDENFDGEAAGWTADGQWGRVEVNGRGKVFTDSPQGNYENHANSSLTSPTISLDKHTEASLLFDTLYAMEDGYDKVHLEASKDGEHWNTLKEYTGTSGAWGQEAVSLGDYEGGDVRFRFRLTSDQSVAQDGFSVDNFRIAGTRIPEPPPEEPPSEGEPPSEQPPSEG